MSFVIKHIDMDLSEASVERALRQIEMIQTLLYPAMMDLIKYYAWKGVEIARIELVSFDDPAYDYGWLYDSVQYEMDESGATISAGKGIPSGKDGESYAAYVEFGTGIFSENGTQRPDGWVYYNERLSRFLFTRGMPPRPFMRNTRDYLADDIRANGGKIIAEYLAENS